MKADLIIVECRCGSVRYVDLDPPVRSATALQAAVDAIPPCPCGGAPLDNGIKIRVDWNDTSPEIKIPKGGRN